MPLVTLTLRSPASPTVKRAMLDAIHQALVASVVPPTDLFQRLFGLNGLDELPDVAAFDPTPEEEGELRERLLKAGEQRAQG